MKIRIAVFLLGALAIGVAIGYEVCSYGQFQKDAAAMSERSMIQEKLRIASLYENIDSREMPAIIPLSDEQRSYVIEVLSAMIRVIAGSTPLELEERMYLGTGQFYWPKNPDEPVRLSRSYFGENFRMAGIAANINRKSENSPWTRFSASVHPRNFPRGVYSMQLPSSFFKEFELQKVAQEMRDGERIANPIVFYFKHKHIRNVMLKVEARDDVASTRDSLPSSLHALEIRREH